MIDPIDCLPHRPPFRFLTRVLERSPGKRATAEWVINGDEDFFAGHFPGNPLLPGVLLGEAMAQLSGLVVFGKSENEQAQEAMLAHLVFVFANPLPRRCWSRLNQP